MGYYANGTGEIVFYQLSNAQGKEIEEIIQWYEYEWAGRATLSIWCYDKYDYETEEMLDKIASIAPVKDGFMQFTGEDDCHWQFLYNKNTRTFYEDNGYVIYASEMKLKPETLPKFIEELRDVFKNNKGDEEFCEAIQKLLIDWEALRLPY